MRVAGSDVWAGYNLRLAFCVSGRTAFILTSRLVVFHKVFETDERGSSGAVFDCGDGLIEHGGVAIGLAEFRAKLPELRQDFLRMGAVAGKVFEAVRHASSETPAAILDHLDA